MSSLLTSPLHDRHLALGAKLAEFGGWEMPLEYTGVLKEHDAVRRAVGVFDVSHLGKIDVRGPGAAAYVNATLSNDLAKIEPGKAQYTLCCDDPSGGVVDDLIAYLHDDDRVFLMPNASNTAEVARRLANTAPDGVEVREEHRDHCVLAVQGPRSDEVLSAVGLPVGHGYMSFVVADAESGLGSVAGDGGTVTVCRTGYTGERGYELVTAAADAGALWDALLAVELPGAAGGSEPVRVAPCGLGARDTLRTEMGYPLHGQDVSLEITPVQARLGWAVGWKKDAFWGRDALVAEREAGPSRVLRGLVASGRGIPRPGMSVRRGDDEVGTVTSGTFSPSRRQGVGLALLAADVTDGDEVVVDVRGRTEVFTVTKPPFVEPGVSS